MRKFLHAAAASLLLTLTSGGPGRAEIPKVSDGDSATLTAINSAWLRSYETRNPETFQRVLSADFIGLYDGRALSKAQMIAALASRPPTKVSWEDLQVSVNGDTAVVTAVSTIVVQRPDGEASTRYRYADIYVRRPAGWQAIASHVTKLG